MFGILNLNKPAGWTSRDAVNRVQRLVKPAKAGHAGTLDPLATGVLVICVGPATRLIEHVQRLPKRYVGTFQLGVTSPSDDTELETTPVANAPTPTREQIEQAVPSYVGNIQQRPPAYSAIKVKGRKAYDLARRGEAVDLPSRPVTVHSIDIVRYEYPELVLDIACGSGTYIRSLGRDLARSLGTGAVMCALERTAIGEFTTANASTAEQLLEEGIEAHLQPAVQAVADIPSVQFSNLDVEEIDNGRYVKCEVAAAEELAALDEHGKLIALLIPRGVNLWGPKMVFRS